MHTVISVEDARTVVLEDGSLLRLSGLLPPALPLFETVPTRPARAWPPLSKAIAALEKLTVGHAITVSYVSPKRDRYGTLQAHIFVHSDDLDNKDPQQEASKSLIWVQEDLLKNGYAHAYEPFGQSSCFSLLLSFTHEAQQKKLGMWAHPAFRPLPANKTASLLKRRGSYARVRGRILNVAHRSAKTYLNFGNIWRTDFTITVPRSITHANPAWAKSLQDMTSRTVEVEGFLTARGGPMIELESPAQLHVVEMGEGTPKALFRQP